MDDSSKAVVISLELQTELEAMILSGNTIAAIKHLRATTGCGLNVALHWVNAWIEHHFRKRDDDSPL